MRYIIQKISQMHLIKNFHFYSKLLELNESYSAKDLRSWKEKIRKLCLDQEGDFEEACRALNLPLSDSSGLSDDLTKILDEICTGDWELENGVINVSGSVNVHNYKETGSLIRNGKFVPEIVFGKIQRDFEVHKDLVSLEGCPTEVQGNFKIDSRELESLVGSPRIVKSDYKIINSKIQNLVGCPDFVGRDFELGGNKNLSSLQGSENCEVKNCFEVHGCNLTSLEGGPKVFDGSIFRCNDNGLQTLSGAPASSKAYQINCEDNPGLYSLEGLPLNNVCRVNAKKCLFPEAVLKEVYAKAREYNSWTAAYFHLLKDERFKRMSKAQRDPIRAAISPEALQSKSFALSSIWKDPIMDDPAVKRLMKKVQLSDEQISDTEMMSDFEDLGIY